MILRFFILSLGVFCAGTSVVMTKASQLPAEYVAGGRLIIAALLLLPIYIRDQKRHPEFKLRQSLRISGLPALLLVPLHEAFKVAAELRPEVLDLLLDLLHPVS